MTQPVGGPGGATEVTEPRAGQGLALVIAWLWVGIPAVWGIWHVIRTSLQLFR